MSSRFDSYTFHGFAKRIIDRFRPILTGQDALNANYTIGDQRATLTQITFNDLVPLAVEILKKSAIARNAIRQTYSDVFLDEFQDCTTQQYQLIKYAFQGTCIRLTAVGDTKQKIMGWAGALEGIFLTFAQDFNAIPLNLYRNFRSQQKLLKMQNEVIKIMDPASVMPADLLVGGEGIIEVQNYADSQEEAVAIADQINLWIDAGVPIYEIAILVSKQANLYAELVMNELERRGIAYRNEQHLQDLSTQPVTQLIIDYLLVLLGEREPDAYIRLIRVLTSSALDEDDREQLQKDWLNFIISEQKKIADPEQLHKDFKAIWMYIGQFLTKVGRDKMASLSYEYESLPRLKEIIRETKQHLLESMKICPNIFNALSLLTENHAVRIMTIHKSKGLEFDTVVLLGVENETFWGKVDEERCVYFVGISRAKRRLILTHADYRSRPSMCINRWNSTRTPQQEFISYASI